MNLRLSYIISFLLGAGVLGAIFWINSQGNNGVDPSSNIYQTILKEQDKLKEQVTSRISDKAGIDNYKIKLESALADVKSISVNALISMSKTDTIKSIDGLFAGIDQARLKILRDIYGTQVQDNSFLKKELDNSFANIDGQLFRSFRTLYDYYSYPVGSDNKARAKVEIAGMFNDSLGLKSRVSSIASTIDFEIGRLRSVVAEIDENIKDIQIRIETHGTSLGDLNKSSKDRLLMVVVLPIFAIIIILLFVIPYLYKDNSIIVSKLFEEKIILQVFTVFILVITILLLGIGDKIKAETLGTLLGGISVYVLQNALGNGAGQQNQKP